MKINISIFLLVQLLPLLLSAQVDSTTLFERSKKTLSHPLSSFKKLINYDSIKNKIQGDPIIGNTYYTDKEDSVRSIFEGTVIAVFRIQDEYAVVSKVGIYYITYSGLKMPFVKKGDVVKKHCFLGILARNQDRDCQLELLMSRGDKYLDPMKWIK